MSTEVLVPRTRRNLFLPNVFLTDCPNLFLDNSYDSESEEEVVMNNNVDSIEDIDADKKVETEIVENDLIDDIEDDLEDDLEDDSGEMVEQKQEPPKKSKSESESELEIDSEPKAENGCELPNLYDHDSTRYRDVVGYIEQYDTMPKWFIDVNTWPRSANLGCWNCDCKIRGFPWFIPLTEMRKCVPYDHGRDFNMNSVSDAALLNLNSNKRYKEVEVMKPHGCFCTAFCAKRYLNRTNDEKIINQWQSNKLLKKLYRMVTGKSIEDIPEALDKTVMIQYCGSKDGITSEEYRIRNEARAEEYL